MASKSVEIENFDVMRLGLRKELAKLTKSLESTLQNRSKLNVSVDHIKELIQVLMTLLKALSDMNFTTKVEIPEIKVPDINIPDVIVPEIKVPSVYVPEPKVTVNPAEVNIDLKGVIKALDNLKYLSDRANKPLAVRLSDGNKFTKAIQELKNATEQMGVVYAGQNGLTIDEYRAESGLPKSVGSGSRTVATAGSSVQLSATSVPCKWVNIVALEANTGSIWVGGSNVADGVGMPLVGLQSTDKIETSDLSNIYLDSTVNGEGVSYIYGA